MRDEIKIRRARPEDAEAIHTVLSESYKEFKSSYTPGAYRYSVVTAEETRERMKEGPIWVATENENIVGTASGVQRKSEFYIRGMSVLPTMRGRKIGYSLMRCAEAYAIKQKCDTMALCTSPYLDAAIRLYKKFGFAIHNDPPHHMFGTPRIGMIKKINAEAAKATQADLSDTLIQRRQLYMIVEKFKSGERETIYQRLQKKGRMLPAGVEYVNSFLSEDAQTCYQLIKSVSREKINTWIDRWKDVIDFEVVPIEKSTGMLT